jgi:hypothetical protein
MATRRYEGPSGTQIQTTAGDVLKAAEAMKVAIEADFAKRLKRWQERDEARKREKERTKAENEQAIKDADSRYQSAMVAWLALPWWKRRNTPQPIRAVVHPRSAIDIYTDMFLGADKPHPGDYPAFRVADTLVKAMSPLPPDTLVMIDANDAALIGLGATIKGDGEAK